MSTVEDTTKTDEVAVVATAAAEHDVIVNKESDDSNNTAAADTAAADTTAAAAGEEVEENEGSENSADDGQDDDDDDVDLDEDKGEDNDNNNDNNDNNIETKKESSADEIEEKEKKNSSPPNPLVERPTKRSRTAYFIFADHMRPSIRKEFPDEKGVATMAKRIGHKWKEITIEEKEKFQLIASKEKEVYKEQLEAYKKQMGDDYVENTNQSSSALSADHPNSLIFPIARISKIAKLDPDINAISKEGINLIVKSTELFLSKLGTDSMKVASQSNRRTIYSDDIKQICSSGQKQEFLFLKEDIKDITEELLLQKENQKLLKIANANALKAGGNEEGGGGEGEDGGGDGAIATAVLTGKAAAAAAGSKPLTSYFTSK